MPLWIARYFGWANALMHVDLNWHMHEMVFGFAIAVIVGFLYTAGRNWSGLWTPRRKTLAALADVAFLPAAAWSLYRVLKRSGNKRNM